MERVQKIISNSGYCSRRKAEELIEKGMVKVNNKTIELGTKADKNKDEIKINNTTLNLEKNMHYYILNKPKGILVTKQDPEGRRVIYDLNAMLDLRDKINQELNYVGRLDGMSEGLLILTNDGELNNLLTHPKHHATKTYTIRTEPKISETDIKKIENGIMIDNKNTYGNITDVKDNTFNMTIKEGRNRIIRRILEETLNYKIYLLKRIEMADIKLGNLETGQLKEIPLENIKKLKKRLLNPNDTFKKNKTQKEKNYEKSSARKILKEKLEKDGIKTTNNNFKKSNINYPQKVDKNNKYKPKTNYKNKDNVNNNKDSSKKNTDNNKSTIKSKTKKPFYTNAIKFSKRKKK